MFVAWVDGCPNGTRPVELVAQGGIVSKASWEKSQKVLETLYIWLILKNCRTWMVWDTHLPLLLVKTRQYSSKTPENIDILRLNWQNLINQLAHVWESIVHGAAVPAQQLDDLELIEHNLLFHDDGNSVFGVRG
ncbi:hypothetical protein DFH28DRAFT_888738 [Melampsora americana]|nr:hypothetical protein DFH28DRAFT_888738 [Melampsora americana]